MGDRTCDGCGGSGRTHTSGCPLFPGRYHVGLGCDFECGGVTCVDCGGDGWSKVESSTFPSYDPLDVPCPRCEQPPEEPCILTTGEPRDQAHIIRYRAAKRRATQEADGGDQAVSEDREKSD